MLPNVNKYEMSRGVQPPRCNDALPPVSDFSPYFRIFCRLHRKFRFSSAKISDDIFSSTLNLSIPPLFQKNSYIFPLFRKKLSFPPTFNNFPFSFVLWLFFTYFACFFTPVLTMMNL